MILAIELISYLFLPLPHWEARDKRRMLPFTFLCERMLENSVKKNYCSLCFAVLVCLPRLHLLTCFSLFFLSFRSVSIARDNVRRKRETSHTQSQSLHVGGRFEDTISVKPSLSVQFNPGTTQKSREQIISWVSERFDEETTRVVSISSLLSIPLLKKDPR